MLTILTAQQNILIIVIGLFLAAAVIGVLQLIKDTLKYRNLLIALVALALLLESVILILRAISIKAVPLTGLFESMLVMTIVFGITYIALRRVIKEAWFGSVMSWLMLAMAVLTIGISAPAAERGGAVETPWVLAHGLAMVIAGTLVIFSAVIAHFFLFSNRKLKQRDVSAVVGRMPNIETLERLNLFGLRACFILLTFGIISGIGLALMRQMTLQSSVINWLFDPKIICILTAWILIMAILLMRQLGFLGTKNVALMTIIAFILIFIAFVAVTLIGITHHSFQAMR